MRKETQKDKVLKILRSQGHISRNECLKMFISRLGAIICDLRRDGLDIEAKWVEGDYVYTLNSKPRDVITYRVNGEVVGTKTIW